MKSTLSPTLRLSWRTVLLASLAGVLHAGAAPFVIAQRGQPANCVIVLPAAPSEAESYAAQELQNFTRRMTGVELVGDLFRSYDGPYWGSIQEFCRLSRREPVQIDHFAPS